MTAGLLRVCFGLHIGQLMCVNFKLFPSSFLWSDKQRHQHTASFTLPTVNPGFLWNVWVVESCKWSPSLPQWRWRPVFFPLSPLIVTTLPGIDLHLLRKVVRSSDNIKNSAQFRTSSRQCECFLGECVTSLRLNPLRGKLCFYKTLTSWILYLFYLSAWHQVHVIQPRPVEHKGSTEERRGQRPLSTITHMLPWYSGCTVLFIALVQQIVTKRL